MEFDKKKKLEHGQFLKIPEHHSINYSLVADFGGSLISWYEEMASLPKLFYTSNRER